MSAARDISSYEDRPDFLETEANPDKEFIARGPSHPRSFFASELLRPAPSPLPPG